MNIVRLTASSELLRGLRDVDGLKIGGRFTEVGGGVWTISAYATDEAFKPSDRPDSDRLCYTAHYAVPFDKSARQCGLLLDEWTEVTPATTRTTGITFHFDRSASEPPQAILVVTPASATGSWQWDDLVGALNETLDLAKLRAVEPADVDQTPYSVLVPATITAVTLYGISIAKTIPYPFSACSRSGPAYLTITPVTTRPRPPSRSKQPCARQR